MEKKGIMMDDEDHLLLNSSASQNQLCQEWLQEINAFLHKYYTPDTR